MFAGMDKPAAELSNSQIQRLKHICRFDYWKLPEEMRFGTNPQDLITLYKGALRQFQQFPYSEAVKRFQFNKITDITRLVEDGRSESLRQTVENHVAGYSGSPFLSTSLFPAVAQSAAGHQETIRKDTTIFELKVRADRLIHVGSGHYSEKADFTGYEVLVIGSLFPEDFVAVKKSNLLQNSELLFQHPVFGQVVTDPVISGFKNISLPKIELANWELIHSD